MPWVILWAPLITPFCFQTWAFFQLLRLLASKDRLPKYSFSDAKLPAWPAGWRFWHLVSEKNTCVGIPKGINRGVLVTSFQTGDFQIPIIPNAIF